MKTCLDLFAGLGGFSQAFEESDDWRVVTVEIEEEFDPDICADVMDLRPSDLPDADVVLAGHPCTEFSTVQNLNGGHTPDPDHIAMVYHTIGLIKALSPRFWFLENPRGKLRTIIGQPVGTVTYCQYDRDYQKPTDLWGEHPTGFSYRSCRRGADCHESNRDGTNNYDEDPAEKALAPFELSKAILDAVQAAEKAPRRQAELTEVEYVEG